MLTGKATRFQAVFDRCDGSHRRDSPERPLVATFELLSNTESRHSLDGLFGPPALQSHAEGMETNGKQPRDDDDRARRRRRPWRDLIRANGHQWCNLSAATWRENRTHWRFVTFDMSGRRKRASHAFGCQRGEPHCTGVDAHQSNSLRQVARRLRRGALCGRSNQARGNSLAFSSGLFAPRTVARG